MERRSHARRGGGECATWLIFNYWTSSSEQILSCISDPLKEGVMMTVMRRKEHHEPRSSVNPKNAGGLKRFFFSALVL